MTFFLGWLTGTAIVLLIGFIALSSLPPVYGRRRSRR